MNIAYIYTTETGRSIKRSVHHSSSHCQTESAHADVVNRMLISVADIIAYEYGHDTGSVSQDTAVGVSAPAAAQCHCRQPPAAGWCLAVHIMLGKQIMHMTIASLGKYQYADKDRRQEAHQVHAYGLLPHVCDDHIQCGGVFKYSMQVSTNYSNSKPVCT